jgi:hypothetical protein
MTEALTVRRNRGRLPWVGALVGIAALVWVLRGFDLDRFREILAGADPWLVALVPVAIMGEQVVRAWKWPSSCPSASGTVARSWLVARRTRLKLPAVLATVALDRLTDGVVFAALVPVALCCPSSFPTRPAASVPG